MHPAQAEGFEWDEANEEHLLRHRITETEVEEVFECDPVWRPNRGTGSGDWQMIGRTYGGRWLTIIVLVLEEERLLRAFTGFPATDSEIAIYRRQRGGRR